MPGSWLAEWSTHLQEKIPNLRCCASLWCLLAGVCQERSLELNRHFYQRFGSRREAGSKIQELVQCHGSSLCPVFGQESSEVRFSET